MGVYTYSYLAYDVIYKRFSSVIMQTHARDPAEFDELVKHEGDELAYVLEGEIELHTEIYAPLRLEVGESVFFDSSVGPAYVNVSDGDARILCIGSDIDGVSAEPMIVFAQHALAKAGQPAVSRAPKRRARKLSAVER